MSAEDEGKYKGLKGPGRGQGLGRLRRASSKPVTRQGGWERHAEDDAFLEQHGSVGRRSHAGEALLAKFNRLASGSQAPDAPAGEPGVVCGFDGALIVVRTASGEELPCTVRKALTKRIKGEKNPLCVGDRVRYAVQDVGTVVVGFEPRTNQLARADSHNKALLHVLAANLDRLVVVAAMRDPELKAGFIDRYLVIAASNGIPAAVVFNKCDLDDPTEPAALYRGLGYPVFTTSATASGGEQIDGLRRHLSGLTALFAGQSGVGKSSLINALYPGLGARVRAVSGTSGLGRHTTTSARSYRLPDGGSLVDTPGIRECGITGLTPIDVALSYPELAERQSACHFGDCTHLHEPGCAVKTAVEAGEIAMSRYESYRSIISEDLAQGPKS